MDPAPDVEPRSRPRLDIAVAATMDDDPRAWDPRRAVAMLVAIVVVLVAFGSVVQVLNLGDWQLAWANIVGEIALAVPVVLYARPAVAASGGWGAAFGLGELIWSDVPLAIGWAVVQFVARLVATVVLIGLLPAAKDERVSNVPSLADKPWTVVVPLFIAAAVMAPVVEELAFRGVLLRSFMRRWGFQTAAVVTGLLFGLLHFEQAGGPAASVVLAATLALFGYLQAVLVRRTARLAPAMLVHGLNNAVGILFALHIQGHWLT